VKHGPEKSDTVVVAGKPTNNAARAAAEPVERRTVTKGNADQHRARRAQDRESVSQALERAYGKPHGNGRRRGSPHSSTTSTPRCRRHAIRTEEASEEDASCCTSEPPTGASSTLPPSFT
jgi:hypothetical protein